MNSAPQPAGHLCGPTIFSHDSDDQVLAWLNHAQTMTQTEGRWRATWQLFASEAMQECKRRNLLPAEAQTAAA